MAEKRNVAFLVLFIAAVFVVAVFGAVYIGLMMYAGEDVSIGESVAVVDIRGTIYYDLWKIQEIEGHRDNDDVKAILLFINSPGGGVTASQAIYQAVRRAQAEKPVVAFMASVVASGGYYIACAADSIVAHPGTLTGSIGVIASFLNTQELYQKIGLNMTVITTGKFKDVGSPHRPMTEAEKAYLGQLLDNLYQQFLQAVADGRRMSVGRAAELAQGRLYSGEEARAAGLVDVLGTYEEALELAAEMGGIDGEPRVIRRHKRRSLAERILGESVPRLPSLGDERIRVEYIIP